MTRIVVDGLLHCTYGPAIITESGDKWWYYKGHLHREDGPAIEHANGAREWWILGARHRDIEPAIITPSKMEWWHYGQLHRDDGPAVEYVDGTYKWMCNGKTYPFDEWCDALNLSDNDRLILTLKWSKK